MLKPFGLTGNIGCGKSTVAMLLLQISEPLIADVVIFDTDQIAKNALKKKIFFKPLKEIFGKNIFKNKELDLSLLAKIIFSDDKKRSQLEALIHPYVWQQIEMVIDKRTNLIQNNKTIYIVESALLYEIGWQDKFRAMIVVSCDEAEQKRRLRENRLMSNDAINKRIDAQLSSEEKEKRADLLVRTDCNLFLLERRVQNLYNNLVQLNRTL